MGQYLLGNQVMMRAILAISIHLVIIHSIHSKKYLIEVDDSQYSIDHTDLVASDGTVDGSDYGSSGIIASPDRFVYPEKGIDWDKAKIQGVCDGTDVGGIQQIAFIRITVFNTHLNKPPALEAICKNGGVLDQVNRQGGM